MRIYAPDFAKDFRCIGGACPDSCCRQGWQIEIDDAHRALYEKLPEPLGARVRAAVTDNELKMVGGVCALLDNDGLCPIVKALGEDGLCDLCRTHPRFIEQYGGVREVHFSLSCPEVARLALMRVAPIRFSEAVTDEEITEPCDIDPDEYLALLTSRTFAIGLMQNRTRPFSDRLTLLLAFAPRAQRMMDEKRYAAVDALLARFQDASYAQRVLTFRRRLRKRGTSFLPEITLLRKFPPLTAELPQMLKAALFTKNESAPFDRENAVQLEHLTVLWLAHYVPKAVNDGRLDTKILFAALLTLCARRFCVCAGCTIAHAASLLAKELEHNPDAVSEIYRALENPFWARHLTAHLEEATYAI